MRDGRLAGCPVIDRQLFQEPDERAGLVEILNLFNPLDSAAPLSCPKFADEINNPMSGDGQDETPYVIVIAQVHFTAAPKELETNVLDDVFRIDESPQVRRNAATRILQYNTSILAECVLYDSNRRINRRGCLFFGSVVCGQH
ncbi:hypothetical protein IPV69_18755 [Humisphaera borealis]|uniref:Uncharacterized protein n=1 Tax=Humisphaera borealis TaxID=2807512 RepID=A0A7M2X4L7_9BACT|nr:hypothetical protein [Humisphaera borealis]QOV92569.1 hypothetical protein IPV69_18755 [Humisphaera borealis]